MLIITFYLRSSLLESQRLLYFLYEVVSIVAFSLLPVIRGIPQGSIFSPYQFSIYVLAIGNITKRHGVSFYCHSGDNKIYNLTQSESHNFAFCAELPGLHNERIIDKLYLQ